MLFKKSIITNIMTYTSLILSGLPGSGKSVLSSRLEKILNWKIHSIGDLWRKEHKEAQSNGETKSFEDWWEIQPMEKQLDVNVKLKELLKKGEIIGDSRYSSVYCQDIPSLTIFITASLDIRSDRAYQMGKYDGKSVNEIKTILEKREQDELKMGKELFGDTFDYRHSNNYHLVLNSGNLTIGKEVNSIVNLL